MAVAILGAGLFAKEAHIPALKELGDDAPPLKAVYSHSLESASNLASLAAFALGTDGPPSVYHDADPNANLDTLLARNDISSVIVVLPICLQPSIILKALEAGKHVLSEKPVAQDVETGLDLIASYEAKYKPKGLVWRVAENFESESIFRAAGDSVRAGKIGQVRLFHARVVNHVDGESKWYKTPWRKIPDYQGGFLLDGGVHTIAALRTVLPFEFSHLSAFAPLNKEILAPHDTISTIVKADNNAHGTLDMTFAHPTQSKPNTDAYLFTGDKGWISINMVTPPGAPSAVFRMTTKTLAPHSGGEEEVTVTDASPSGVRAELASFFAKVKGQETTDIGDPAQALKDVAFIQAALTSEGSLVDLRQLVKPKA
jgi:predicted dehydrogenase